MATLKERIPSSYFSIADTCFISILPLVSRAADTFPLKSSPSFAIFRRMSLTSSPKYRLLIIFSNLERSTGRISAVQPSTASYQGNHLLLTTHEQLWQQPLGLKQGGVKGTHLSQKGKGWVRQNQLQVTSGSLKTIPVPKGLLANTGKAL